MSAPVDQGDDGLLVRALLRRIAFAREDPSRFFSMVMREEASRARITTLPHQEVIFAFTESFERCVLRCPVGSSKTYTMTALGLYLLGRDPTQRGAIISALEASAAKPVGMVRDYIEQSAELHAVFPTLRQSTREGDPWTQTRLTVERPFGIRDPSLIAAGLDSKALPGSRLSWILVDDILDPKNVLTPMQRAQVRHWFFTVVMTRKDVERAKVVVANTPRHPEDLTFVLSNAGWPTLEMDLETGDIFVTNAPGWAEACPMLRPSTVTEGAWRLVAHDAPEYLEPVYGTNGSSHALDDEDQVPLWPERYPARVLEKLREEFPEHEFQQDYKCKVRNEATAKVKVEWIEACKARARELHYHTLQHEYRVDAPNFTGLDLGIGQTDRHAKTVIFTFTVLPESGLRLPLEIDEGHYSGRQIVDKLVSVQKRYGSIIRVENNAAQDLLIQWARDADASLIIRPHTTGKNKADPLHGLESVFIEIEKGLWLFPNDVSGRCPPAVLALVNALRDYDPSAHTADILMAMWFAREQARRGGFLASRRSTQQAAGLLGLLAH